MLRSPWSLIRNAVACSVLALLTLSVGSCGQRKEAATDTSAPPPATTSAPAADTAWSDASIAAAVIAANTLDIRNAQLAQSISKNPAVMTFASRMTSDHTLLNAKTNELGAKLSILPRDNDVSRGLTSQANAKRDSIKVLSGAEFDKAYIAAEVDIHRGAIDLFDQVLIPRAQNAELKLLLEGARPILQGHLAHANAVHASLSR